MTDDTKQFSQEGIQTLQPKTVSDFFTVQGNTLKLHGVLQTVNYIPGSRGVQINPAGFNANVATINGTLNGTVTPTNVITVPHGGTGANTLTGILKGNGTGAITTVAGVSGSFYVANSSGGSPTHLVTVTNGIITAIA